MNVRCRTCGNMIPASGPAVVRHSRSDVLGICPASGTHIVRVSDTGWEESVCGCRWSVVDRTFTIEPCSLQCELYVQTVALGQERGNEVTVLDAR